MKEIKVSNCHNCCFSSAHFGENVMTSAQCLAPVEVHEQYNIESYYKNYKSPAWCPLKKSGGVSIKFGK